MIPDILKPYEADLKKYERECIRIKATPREELPLEDTLDLKDCKFLGLPFFPKTKNYPKDIMGRPMIMIAQLNFEQIPHLEHFPRDGILQLFIAVTNWEIEEANSTVIYHTKEELEIPPMDDFSFLKEKDYSDSPVYKLHELAFERSTQKGSLYDVEFDMKFDEEFDKEEFMDDLEDEEQDVILEYLNASGHLIGGYADFTQTDPREYDETKEGSVQILQIDTDKEIMFGDSGIGHIFIKKDDLIMKNLDRAHFYWDCC